MDSAAPSSRLMTMIRSGFQRQGGLSVSTPLPVAADPVSTVFSPAVSTPTLQESLDVLDKVLTEVEQSRVATPPAFDSSAQIIPQVVDQATDTLNAGYTGSTAKEAAGSTPAVEAATGLQYVEEEKSPEIPVEVESYLQKVEQADIQLPNEIVIADQAQTPLASHYVRQPVIVLPITPEIEAAGASKSPVNSIRWLVEFSRKLMKMFTGKVVYYERAN